ncbi:hypothetical protein CLI64_00095 [Nostoc sp. CENA543]|nr:hypothetical protein CLI64_00095 [Nostoc sp. CENA543]
MRTHKASQKQSSVNNSLVSRPFVVQPKAEERKESPGTQGYKSQMPEFAIFNPAGEQSPVQPKLAIGAPGDKYEQEADRTAKLVVQRINAPAIARSTSEPSIQRRGGLEGGEASTDLESAINSARSGGQPLDAGLQAKMSTAMGADFSGVRVHTDTQSDQLNRSIQAKAFTTGQDVFFRQGEYQPGSRGGQELIAHELTHVVQQNGGTVQRFSQQKSQMGQISIVQKPNLNDKLIVNHNSDQNTIQRFYAVKDEENSKSHPTANTGRIDELNLEWIELPDPRDESEYPETVEGTGWLYYSLYTRKGKNPVKRKRVKQSIPPIGSLPSMDSSPFSTPYTGGKGGKPKTIVESILGVAPMIPVPTGLADKSSKKAREKISDFTPQSPIQEGIKETITDRVELMKEGIQDPRNTSEPLKWADYYVFGGGKEDLARVIDIASAKMSKEEAERFKADLEKCQFEQTVKMGAKVGFGMAIGQAIGMIPHPAAKAAKVGWTVTGGVALNNKMVKVNEELEKVKQAHPTAYKVMEDHRNQKMEEVHKERHRMVEVYAKSLETMGNPFA